MPVESHRRSRCCKEITILQWRCNVNSCKFRKNYSRWYKLDSSRKKSYMEKHELFTPEIVMVDDQKWTRVSLTTRNRDLIIALYQSTNHAQHSLFHIAWSLFSGMPAFYAYYIISKICLGHYLTFDFYQSLLLVFAMLASKMGGMITYFFFH